MLKTASFLTEVPEWTQPPKPPQDGTGLIYYKSIVICLGSGAMSGTKLTPNRALTNARLGNHQS